MSNNIDSSDVVIIGRGLAGPTTAALLARSRKSVTVFERSSKEIGGRARSTEVDGFYFNQGPHALCLTDLNNSILKEIGITVVIVTWWEWKNQTSTGAQASTAMGIPGGGEAEPVARISTNGGQTFGPLLELATNGTIGGESSK